MQLWSAEILCAVTASRGDEVLSEKLLILPEAAIVVISRTSLRRRI